MTFALSEYTVHHVTTANKSNFRAVACILDKLSDVTFKNNSDRISFVIIIRIVVILLRYKLSHLSVLLVYKAGKCY